MKARPRLNVSFRGTPTRRQALAAAVVVVVMLTQSPPGHAQFGFPGGPPATPWPPQEAAPFDMTGYWVSIVNEDWRWRMVTPPKGDTQSIVVLNTAGRAEAERWDEAEDGSCKAYGAGGLMRMPTRLHIMWDTDAVLRIDTDAGNQTRLLRFEPPARSDDDAPAQARPSPPPSLQGDSVARWILARGQGRRRGAQTPPPTGGSLRVTTTNLTAGWLRRNGVPYSDQTTVTEFYDQFTIPTGDEWLVVTTIVEDPVYLSGPFVTSSHFRREPDDSRWNPTPCRSN